MITDVAETARLLRELGAGNQLLGLEAMAERDGQGIKDLGPSQRLIVNRTDRGYSYHEAQGSAGGAITRQEALGLLQATLSTEDCPQEEEGIGERCGTCGGCGCDCQSRPEGERYHSPCPACHGEGAV